MVERAVYCCCQVRVQSTQVERSCDERFGDLCGPFISVPLVPSVVPLVVVAPVAPVAPVVVAVAPGVLVPVVVVAEGGSVVESWGPELADLGESSWETPVEVLRVSVDPREEDELRRPRHPPVHHEGGQGVDVELHPSDPSTRSVL